MKSWDACMHRRASAKLTIPTYHKVINIIRQGQGKYGSVDKYLVYLQVMYLVHGMVPGTVLFSMSSTVHNLLQTR